MDTPWLRRLKQVNGELWLLLSLFLIAMLLQLHGEHAPCGSWFSTFSLRSSLPIFTAGGTPPLTAVVSHHISVPPQTNVKPTCCRPSDLRMGGKRPGNLKLRHQDHEAKACHGGERGVPPAVKIGREDRRENVETKNHTVHAHHVIE